MNVEVKSRQENGNVRAVQSIQESFAVNVEVRNQAENGSVHAAQSIQVNSVMNVEVQDHRKGTKDGDCKL